ncbi:hypothetical protein ABID22_000292 [Pontibacter aydingkolensis]|uniref:Uncharacterized protein n=1 Tax=Pontibacter aydingkolensis TaxID=1911536 RepID=A0ABS7CQC2_9BACT|nr:hypothetical protein [Pontibacter aydingkolensis]MBW7466042.1 hypothetical protein [Pontibacter aydingkolensis]
MKKAILTLISFLVYFNSFGQQQTTIHDIVTITLPNKVEKLTEEKLTALKPSEGKSSPISHEHFNGETYKGKDILIQLNAGSITPKPNYLEQEKRGIDYLFSLSQPQVYSSSIKHYQNQSVVVANFEDAGKDKGYFLIRSYNKTGDSILVGTLEYDKDKKEAAEKALDEMLKSIKFNRQ